MAEKKSIIGKLGAHLIERLKAVPVEVYEHFADRVLPQGSAELAHVIHTGSGYVAYGPGQKSVEPHQDDAGKQAAEMEQPEKTQPNEPDMEM